MARKTKVQQPVVENGLKEEAVETKPKAQEVAAEAVASEEIVPEVQCAGHSTRAFRE